MMRSRSNEVKVVDKEEVEEQIKEIIKLGKSWGMSKSEIDQCLRVAAGVGEIDFNATRAASSSFGVLKLFSCIFRVLKLVVVLMVISFFVVATMYTLLMFFCSISPALENKVGKIVAPLIHPTMRLARIALKPVADYIDIANVYSSDCLLENPFYLDPVEDCGPCHLRTRFADLTGQSAKKMMRSVEELTPFIAKGYITTKIDLPKLQKMYFENERRFRLGGTRMFDSNLDDVRNITDFFYKYNHEDLINTRRGTGYVSWDTNSVPSSQAIRKVFPRPNFVTETSEVSLLKRIYIEGPIAARHEIPVGGFANSWYLQAHGRRKVTLVPHPDCQEECKDIQIILNTGDLVYYQDQFWRLLSDPVVAGGPSAAREISIGFTASFTI